MIDETYKQVVAHAVGEYPRECCGLVLIVKGKETYYPCANLAEAPGDQFIMSGRDFANASDIGEVVAVVHSHPNAAATPSEADKVAAEVSGLPWYIVSVGMSDDVTAVVPHSLHYFEPSGYEAPLIGRQFAHGILDCYTLVRDWYKRERGITLKDWERSDGWWERGEDLYQKHFEETGFKRVNGALQVGDVIFMQIRAKQPNHAAIYLGDDKILHHLYGRLSSRDIYGGYWKDSTVFAVRYVGDT